MAKSSRVQALLKHWLVLLQVLRTLVNILVDAVVSCLNIDSNRKDSRSFVVLGYSVLGEVDIFTHFREHSKTQKRLGFFLIALDDLQASSARLKRHARRTDRQG